MCAWFFRFIAESTVALDIEKNDGKQIKNMKEIVLQ